MDQEKLIRQVKAGEPLYVISHPKYSDAKFKEKIWKRIAKEMKQPVKVCKKTWSNLRDSFRRATKRKRGAKSGQAASKIKKWRFEEEMSFLLPFIQERDTLSNWKDISDDDCEGEPNEDEYNDKNDDREDDNEDDVKHENMNEEFLIEDEEKKKVSRKIINIARNKKRRFQTEPETASAVVMKYLLEKETAKEQIAPSQQLNAIDTFFASITSTVKNFSPYYQNVAKSQIFSIISDLEMEQIMQEQSCSPPNTPLQRPPYHIGPINVPRLLPSPTPSLSPPSIQTPPSKITTPIASPSHSDLPAIILKPKLEEEIIYTEENDHVN